MKYTIINCATNSVHVFVNLVVNHNVLQTRGSHTVLAFIAFLSFMHNATFNNISWRSVLLVEETNGP